MNPTALAQQTIKIEFKRIFSLNFLLIFLAVLLSTLTDQSLNRKIEHIIKSPDGLSNMIWVWGFASLGSSLLFPLLISMLCSYTLSNAFLSKRQMLKEKFELALIETLRAWGKTFLWCFVFIIPGLFKYIYYLLSPFVVFFSKKYEDGQVDALELSEKIAKKFFWRLNIWVTLFYFLLPITLSATIDEFKVFQFHPISATVCVLFESILIFVFHFLILRLFLRFLNEVENGSVL